MRPPRWKALVEKSAAAYCAAIEIYNKPVVPHREETFVILAVSAWELLLKTRLSEFPLSLKHGGKDVEARSGIRMVGAQRLLPDCQCALAQWPRSGEITRRVE